jgi:alpha-amylase
MVGLCFSILIGLVGSAIAAKSDQWRPQSIYFLLTDRFARTDNSTTASCDVSARVRPFTSKSPWTRYATDLALGILWRFLAGYYQPGKLRAPASCWHSILKTIIARLYSRNGVYCDLDHSCYLPAARWHGWWDGISWLLVTGWVSQRKESPPIKYRYWPGNSYAPNSNYGSAADLKALASALHGRGMYLMVDVVANHMVCLA